MTWSGSGSSSTLYGIVTPRLVSSTPAGTLYRGASGLHPRCQKFTMYQSLHTTVIGPEGRPVGLQIRSYEMDRSAELELRRTGATSRRRWWQTRTGRHGMAAPAAGVAARD